MQIISITSGASIMKTKIVAEIERGVKLRMWEHQQSITGQLQWSITFLQCQSPICDWHLFLLFIETHYDWQSKNFRELFYLCNEVKIQNLCILDLLKYKQIHIVFFSLSHLLVNCRKFSAHIFFFCFSNKCQLFISGTKCKIDAQFWVCPCPSHTFQSNFSIFHPKAIMNE